MPGNGDYENSGIFIYYIFLVLCLDQLPHTQTNDCYKAGISSYSSYRTLRQTIVIKQAFHLIAVTVHSDKRLL
jgi:hypothetical protein